LGANYSSGPINAMAHQVEQRITGQMPFYILTPKDQSTDKGIRYKILDKMLHTQVFRGNAAKDGNFGAQRNRCQSFNTDALQYGNGNRFSGI
jgi:hypothetical protein